LCEANAAAKSTAYARYGAASSFLARSGKRTEECRVDVLMRVNQIATTFARNETIDASKYSYVSSYPT
jgi:hypothetical protein